MLKCLDYVFFGFHTLVILFNMTGWIFTRTRRLHLVLFGLTAFSWIGMGAYYGWGYCLCTDWHFQIRRQLGYEVTESSFVQLLFHNAIGVKLTQTQSDVLAVTIFLGIVIATTIVWTPVLRHRFGPKNASDRPYTSQP